MASVRLTQNAIASFRRYLSPDLSLSAAHRELVHACRLAPYEHVPPAWLRRVDPASEGYVVLAGESAVLPIRRGRAVACLVNPQRRRKGADDVGAGAHSRH